jgi:hypothetical protein
LLGIFWYSPKVMGERWMQARGGAVKPHQPGPKEMIVLFGLWLLASCFYSFLVNLLGVDSFSGLFCLSCLLWVAFAMPPAVMGSLYTSYAFEAVSIDAAYHLSGYYIFAIVHTLIRNLPPSEFLHALGAHA